MLMNDVRWSDLLEDALGFGVRSIRSIRQLFVDPRPYFKAAQTPEWSGFTPSFRIYVAFVTVSALLRVFYLGDDGMMTELYTGQFEQILAELSQEDQRFVAADPRLMADKTLDVMLAWTPPIQLVLFTLFGLIWGAYGEKLNAPVRVRYVYALMVPATFVMLIITVLMVLAPSSWLAFLSFGSMVLTAILIAVTAFRGAYPLDLPVIERIIRAGVLGVLIMILTSVAAVVAVVYGMFEAFDMVTESFPDVSPETVDAATDS
jgi:hypothetical protein